ncbi:MAG TPA: aminopeptidase P family protein [Coriobacteriia bacterium]
MTGTARVDALRGLFEADQIDAALITNVENMRYLTGFDRVFDSHVAAAVAVGRTSQRFYTDARYIEAAREAAAGSAWEVVLQGDDLFVRVCEDLKEAGVETLAMESSVPHGRFVLISDCFDGRVVVSDRWVERLRAVKDAGEIEACARAAALTDRAFDHILGILKPGLREIDVSLALEVFMRSGGSEGLAFEPIVASGPNSSRPHAGVTDRVIEAGDILTMDFGARTCGYCADMTRTVIVGAKATAQQRELYEAVLAANEAGIAAVRSGVKAADVDAACRGVLEAAGLAEYFTHSTGHGVGLAVHEEPRVSKPSTDILRVGEVVTIEPGVYLAGRLGVRIEDLVVVQSGGARVLSHSPKHLIELI